MTKWTLSAAWANKNVSCSLASIKQGCGGCCWSKPNYIGAVSGCGNNMVYGEEMRKYVNEWNFERLTRAKTGIRICKYYDYTKGCELTPIEKPIQCGLFPIILKGDKLIMWSRTMLKNSKCGRNINVDRGNILENNPIDFISIFGEKQYAEALISVRMGINYEFEISDELLARWNREKEAIEKSIHPHDYNN